MTRGYLSGFVHKRAAHAGGDKRSKDLSAARAPPFFPFSFLFLGGGRVKTSRLDQTWTVHLHLTGVGHV